MSLTITPMHAAHFGQIATIAPGETREFIYVLGQKNAAEDGQDPTIRIKTQARLA